MRARISAYALTLAGAALLMAGARGEPTRFNQGLAYHDPLNGSSPGFVVQDGRLLKSGEPFSGTVAIYHQNGRLKELSAYALGIRHGEMRTWFKSGSPATWYRYDHGRKDGPQRGWYEGGERRFEYRYTQDVATGEHREWHRNGRPFRLTVYGGDGRELSHKTWRKNGEIYANYVRKGGRVYGLRGGRLCDETTTTGIVAETQGRSAP